MDKLVTVMLPDGLIVENIVQLPEPLKNECFDVDFYQIGENPENTVFIRAFARLGSYTTPFVQIIVSLDCTEYIYSFEVDDEWFIDTTETD